MINLKGLIDIVNTHGALTVEQGKTLKGFARVANQRLQRLEKANLTGLWNEAQTSVLYSQAGGRKQGKTRFILPTAKKISEQHYKTSKAQAEALYDFLNSPESTVKGARASLTETVEQMRQKFAQTGQPRETITEEEFQAFGQFMKNGGRSMLEKYSMDSEDLLENYLNNHRKGIANTYLLKGYKKYLSKEYPNFGSDEDDEIIYSLDMYEEISDLSEEYRQKAKKKNTKNKSSGIILE